MMSRSNIARMKELPSKRSAERFFKSISSVRLIEPQEDLKHHLKSNFKTHEGVKFVCIEITDINKVLDDLAIAYISKLSTLNAPIVWSKVSRYREKVRLCLGLPR